LVLLTEKQHKGLWRQNSLDWLTKQRHNCTLWQRAIHLQFSLLAASPETFGRTFVSSTLHVGGPV